VGDGILGLAGGYSQADIEIDDLKSSAEVDTAWIAGYAGTSLGPWKLRAGGAYGFHFIDSERAISFPGFADHASADYDAGTGQLFGEIGYRAGWRGIDFEPFAGLAWIHLDADGFSESGGPAALRASSDSADVGYSALGLRAAVRYPMANGMIATPRLSAAWQHGFGDLTPAATLAFAQMTNADFTVNGVPLARDSAVIDAGLDVTISPHARFGVSYFGQLAGSSSTNAFRGHFTWSF
jgi:outer membrane autotransporter protein